MRLVLCGSRYGSQYARALADRPRSFEPVGLLSRGSRHSLRLAQQLGVPHYDSVAALPPGGMDAACVAVGGAAGIGLAQQLLERGIPVLAEHPIEPGPLESLITEAERRGVAFHLNSHFGDLESVEPFVEAVRETSRRTPVRFLYALLHLRTLYSGFDVLARALGSLVPFELAPGVAPERPSKAAFVTLAGNVRGVPLSIACQRAAGESDDGGGLLLGHHLVAGFDDGLVTLADTLGPVVWSSRLTVVEPPAPHWQVLTPAVGGSAAGGGLRTRANQVALARFHNHIVSGRRPVDQEPEHLLAVSRAWRTTLDRLGPWLSL